MKALGLLILLNLSTILTAWAQTVATGAADETAVRALVTKFNDAFNAHDVPAFGAVFAPDADFTNWRGMVAHGRPSIETFHVPVLTVLYKNATQKIVDSKVRFLKPDVAVVDVLAEVTGGTTPDGKAAPPTKFLLNWTTMKEADGQWLIKVMHNARLPEEAAPPIKRQ